ncbi:type II secretion system protein GspN [Geoalkalibacter sp.]|uniref:type II secretion system protein GspN n=1 Tax=Geoalkalibacter sp. TaxID=3041440 RepID=UPI00272DEF7C|nr:type II secretion system protein GspN [Geoalkalibacter sp.]
MKFISKRLNHSAPDLKKGHLGSRLLLHLSALGLLLIAFVLTLILLFPVQALRDRVEQMIFTQSGVRVDIGGLSVTPPLTLTLRDLRWQPELRNWPPVQVAALRLSPVWSGLFSANPGVHFNAAFAVGSIQGQASRDGSLKAAIKGVGIAPFLPEAFPYPVQGTLSGNFESLGELLANSGQASVQLRLEGGALTGLESLGAANGRLSLGQVDLRADLQGRNLRIEELRATEGDLRVDGKGTLLLGADAPSSRLTAQIELTPAPSLDPNLADLLLLTGVNPDPTGIYRLRLSGSLAAPVVR